MLKPEPKSINVVCTICGLSWNAHLQGRPNKDSQRPASLEDCVRVLKAELAKRPVSYYGQMAGAAVVPMVRNAS